MIINNKYKITDKIAQGTFGSVFKGIHIRTGNKVAIKVESIERNLKMIKNESTIYNYLKDLKCVPKLKWFGRDDNNYYMVTDLLGLSLQEIKDKNTVIPINTTKKIGVQIIQILQSIHARGLIHRDIKPDNFMLGCDSMNKRIFIIDFGLCKPYINDDSHIEMKNTHNLIGSYKYASINSHNCIELSRRDDLESLCYMLIYLHNGILDWSNMNSNDTEEIKYMKINIMDNVNIPYIFLDFINYVRELRFEQEPDYEYLISILE